MSGTSDFIPKTPREEFEAAALPFLPEIYRTAVGLIGNRETAEDLAQEVFLQAWKSFHKFEKGTNMRAWLHRILAFKALHARRGFFGLPSFRNTSGGNKEGETPDIPVNDPVPDHLSDRQVVEALTAVPSPFREALVLCDVREFSYQEIAEMLKVPIGTVMSRLSRGRKLLRAGLAERGLSR
ncbi:MAG TPA: RNA polymerase sigma factor [Bryobacteraceae bacterium]|jgi:RNA polymerase sigma-70 factor (ECF subfamily)|nr:RNA polymerase sigma factor [Bryobacteraceae bacterium]